MHFETNTAASGRINLMEKHEVCRLFGGESRPLNPATLYRGIKLGLYPGPIKVGANSARWIRAECEAALAKIVARRDAAAA
jgi:predicted DNA-binding transcriptional regulator AlpA